MSPAAPEPTSADARATRTAPSGRQVALRHGDQEVVVVEAGGGLRSYRVGDWDVVAGFGADEVCRAGRGQVLAPWPNRIRDGSYTFDGQAQQLPLTEPALGNAIHGLVRWGSWTLRRHEPDRAVMAYRLTAQPGYPHVLQLVVEYSLGPAGLAVELAATNLGAGPAPFGIGFHPYLSLGTGGVEDVALTVPADTRLVPDDQLIPTAREPVAGTDLDFRHGRPLAGTVLDTAYTGLARGTDGLARAVLARADRQVTLWADSSFDFLQVFTGDTLGEQERRRSVAVEPMSCPADAFNSGDGLVVLGPGDSWTGTWGITPG